jgi:hypothetical protein
MFQVIDCDFVPKQMEECVLKHAAMAVPEERLELFLQSLNQTRSQGWERSWAAPKL